MRTRPVLAAGAAALAIAVAVAGCGASSSSNGGANAAKPANPNAPEVNPAGDIPDNQAFVPYSPPGGGFTVKVPEGWSRTSTGAAVSFTDKLNSIRVESRPANAALTPARAKAAEVPRLAKSVRGFRLGAVTTVRRSAGTAVRITYLAGAKPNAVTGKAGQDAVERYVFFNKGKLLTLTLSGPKGADNVDPWKIVTDSVRWM
jgi:hypothetical protein